MKQGIAFLLLGSLILACFPLLGAAAAESRQNVAPYRGSDDTDAFGLIVRPLPAIAPPGGGQWAGSCWANGVLVMFVNVPPNQVLMMPINANTGMPVGPILVVGFPGQICGATFDGTNFWLCETTTNMIFQINPNGPVIMGMPSPTAPFIAYGIACDRLTGNLWIGANGVNPPGTMIFGMTQQGMVFAAFPTAPMVTWYRDMEICNQILPPNIHIFTVDNTMAGGPNMIRHLIVNPGGPALVASIPSPEVGGLGGVGLGFDGHYLWHNGVLGAMGLIWCIDDGVYPPNFEVSTWPINPPISIPRAGGAFQYAISAHNLQNNMQTIYLWNKVCDAAGIYYNVWGPINRNIGANGWPTRALNQNVNLPLLPAGMARFITYAGTTPALAVDSSEFTFYQSPVFSGEPAMPENTCWGDLPGDPVPETTAIPNQFELIGNFPNPFNASTTLRYSLGTVGFVNLSIYEVSGRKVAVLVNGMRDAGLHEVTFDASGLVSGVYVYRLEAEGRAHNGKMVLLK